MKIKTSSFAAVMAVLLAFCLVFMAPVGAEVTQLNGAGTAENPYLIGTVEELTFFRDQVNTGSQNTYNKNGVYVALSADIDLKNIEWTPIGSASAEHGFMGNFDGKTYKISNLKISNIALDADGYAYAGLFGVTEGTESSKNTIKNLTIENVNIDTTGHIVSAAIAYPYYTIVDNIKVCGDINIKGGDYTAGVLSYTRRCVDASNLYVVGDEGSTITGSHTVGGVISDIQMNGGLTADYSNFCVSGVTISGEKSVGGISGIIAAQTLTNAKVQNVVLNSEANYHVGIVSGSLGGASTITGITVTNVEGASSYIGNDYDTGNPVEAKIGDTYYKTLANAITAAESGNTITLLANVEKEVKIPTGVTLDENGYYNGIPVAKIGEVEYKSLQAAVEAAVSGDTITLLNNITLTETLTIPAGNEVTLDLNGMTLSGIESDAKATAIIENKGDLTICDSSEKGNGKITSKAQNPDTDWGEEGFPTYANNAVKNSGKLTIESGTIECLSPAGGATYAVDNYPGSSLIVNGGTLYCKNNYAIRIFANDKNHLFSVTINDGATVTGTRAIWIQLPSADTSTRNVNVIINGGTLTSTGYTSSSDGIYYKQAIYSYSYGNSMKNVSITINGGTINGDVALTGGVNKEVAETLTITGGTFNGYDGSVYSYAEIGVAKNTMSITGGTFNNDVSNYVADGYHVKINDDNTFTVTDKWTVTFVGIETTTESVTNNTVVSEPAKPTKSGYTFDGWFIDGKAYDFTTPVTSDIILTAKWSKKSTTSKPVEKPEEPVEPETPVEEPVAGEPTVETEVTDGGEVALETPAEEPAVGEGKTPATDKEEAKITAVVLPTGTDSEVTFIPISKQPAPAGKETQTKKVFEINVPTYEKGKPATIKFTMTVAELEADGKTAAEVALWHFDEETGEWTKLLTSYTIVDGIVYFEAITYDFSPFAIIYEETTVDEPVEEPETPATPVPILAVLAGLGAAVVLRRK